MRENETMTNKQAQNALRQRYVEVIKKALSDLGEEVLQTGSNTLAIPCVDDNGEEQFCCFTIKVPTGSRDGDVYDGYGEAESYQLNCKQKAEKAAAEAEKKAKKIARDQAMREQKAAMKAKREG